MSARSARVVLIEPYFRGSHAAFAEAVRLHSRHRVVLRTLPARHWKWRMRGSALWFAGGKGGDVSIPMDAELLMCSDMVSVCDLRALLPRTLRNLPILLYFHENQLTYPLPPGETRDLHYGMTNVISALAADRILFNSEYHRQDFLSAADRLLTAMPDFVPENVASIIAARSDVCYPPVEAPLVRRPPGNPNDPPVFLWCHRWEYDKHPDQFCRALNDVADAGFYFRVVLLGEQFRERPKSLQEFADRHRERILHVGYEPDRRAYWDRLATCDVVVSTAIQENFGIAVVEALLAGCQPVLPNRLVYPEIIPQRFHEHCFYDGESVLVEMLAHIASGFRMSPSNLTDLQAEVRSRFSVPPTIEKIDSIIGDMLSLTNG